MKIELTTVKSEGEPGYIITAWEGEEYKGYSLFIGYTKRKAQQLARQQIREKGGLGIWATR